MALLSIFEQDMASASPPPAKYFHIIDAITPEGVHERVVQQWDPAADAYVGPAVDLLGPDPVPPALAESLVRIPETTEFRSVLAEEIVNAVSDRRPPQRRSRATKPPALQPRRTTPQPLRPPRGALGLPANECDSSLLRDPGRPPVFSENVHRRTAFRTVSPSEAGPPPVRRRAARVLPPSPRSRRIPLG